MSGAIPGQRATINIACKCGKNRSVNSYDVDDDDDDDGHDDHGDNDEDDDDDDEDDDDFTAFI